MSVIAMARERELLAAIALLRKALEVVTEVPYEATPGAVLTIRAVARHALDETEQSVAPILACDPPSSDEQVAAQRDRGDGGSGRS